MDQLLQMLQLSRVAKHIPMRRELKEPRAKLLALAIEVVAKHIPMRRELKGYWQGAVEWDHHVAKHIPMRRELKVIHRSAPQISLHQVAKHIPMRRELKARQTLVIGIFILGRKAHPDEKGTES